MSAEKQIPKKYLVGVGENSDGTLDTSRAMHFTPRRAETTAQENERVKKLSVERLILFAEFLLEEATAAAAKKEGTPGHTLLRTKAENLSSVKKTLENLRHAGVDTFEEALIVLENPTLASENNITMQAELDATINFLSPIDRGENNFEENRKFKEWLQSRDEKKKNDAATARKKVLDSKETASRAGDTAKMQDIHEKNGIPDREKTEREIKELAVAINHEAAKVISASMPKKSWESAGRKERLRDGSDIAVEGKRLSDYDPDNMRGNFTGFFDENGWGAPRSTSLPDNPTHNYLTYAIHRLREPIYNEKMMPVVRREPRKMFGLTVWTKEVSDTEPKRVYVGEKPRTMNNFTGDGDQRPAFALAFRRAGRDYTNRTSDTCITVILPEVLAVKARELISQNPTNATRLFEEITPAWLKDSAAEVKFENDTHIGGKFFD